MHRRILGSRFISTTLLSKLTTYERGGSSAPNAWEESRPRNGDHVVTTWWQSWERSGMVAIATDDDGDTVAEGVGGSLCHAAIEPRTSDNSGDCSFAAAKHTDQAAPSRVGGLVH